MINLNGDQRELLSQVLERHPDLSRKQNFRLRPLSMYSSELKNMKQVAAAVDRVSKGEPLAEKNSTAARYSNTLWNIGLWDKPARGADISKAGAELLQMAAQDDGSKTFWQDRSRTADRIFFEYQVARLLDGRAGLVSSAWRDAFLNVQSVMDHFTEEEMRTALAETDLKEIEALQYLDSVGTEPWRYGRLTAPDKQTVQDLMLKLRGDYVKGQATTDPVETSAIEYAAAINTVQRDVRFRVAGFIQAFLDARAAMGERFPRLTPNREPHLPVGSASWKSSSSLPASGAPPLPLPRQLIISGCPGSGKSHMAETAAASGALVIRTAFHSESTTSTFVGGFRPSTVYEPTGGLVGPSGNPFPAGRPLIDYRFVPGPALLGVAAAVADPERNVVLLIEELNRGNAAAIFGELFLLLDRREDGWSRYDVTLGAEAEAWLRSNGVIEEGAGLRFPPNLYIWATMNSGDQGVFPIDTAFRRRWAYRYLGYAEPCTYPIAERVVRFAGKSLDWDLFRSALNRRLKSLQVNEDRLIGPYFLTRDQLRDPAEVLTKLLLYLWDDVLRFRQQEVFASDSFAGVTTNWRDGEGNPFIDGIVDLDAATSVADAPVDQVDPEEFELADEEEDAGGAGDSGVHDETLPTTPAAEGASGV